MFHFIVVLPAFSSPAFLFQGKPDSSSWTSEKDLHASVRLPHVIKLRILI